MVWYTIMSTDYDIKNSSVVILRHSYTKCYTFIIIVVQNREKCDHYVPNTV